jgi:hypothetical protein
MGVVSEPVQDLGLALAQWVRDMVQADQVLVEMPVPVVVRVQALARWAQVMDQAHRGMALRRSNSVISNW